MHKKSLIAGIGALILTGAAVAAGVSGAAATSHQTRSLGASHISHLCPAKAAPGHMTCFALRMMPNDGRILDGPPDSALDPTELQDAYNLKGLKSHGATVAIVDAFGYPNLERDLGVFRDYFGLPACTTKNGCLTIINQRGGRHLPPFSGGWAGEQALDVDAVSSACPDCKIVVVQTDHSSIPSLGKGVDTAAKQKGVVAISNSYGGHDIADFKWKYWQHRNMAVTASTGDSGYVGHASSPASSRYVVAVGGTSLVKSAKARGWSESAWGGAGSGCARFNLAVPGSKHFDLGCPKRAVADVSAAADPGRGGLAWYGPSSEEVSHWGQVGGTSESSPIIASVFALSGNTKGFPNTIPYQHARQMYDITTGTNGTCDPYPKQVCNARKGWDGPTGLGTPNGVKGF